MKHILLNNLGNKQSGNEILASYLILQNKFFHENFLRKMYWELDTLIFKESSEKKNLRR